MPTEYILLIVVAVLVVAALIFVVMRRRRQRVEPPMYGSGPGPIYRDMPDPPPPPPRPNPTYAPPPYPQQPGSPPPPYSGRYSYENEPRQGGGFGRTARDVAIGAGLGVAGSALWNSTTHAQERTREAEPTRDLDAERERYYGGATQPIDFDRTAPSQDYGSADASDISSSPSPSPDSGSSDYGSSDT